MSVKKQLHLAIIILIASFLLFGCGSSNDEFPSYKLTITNEGSGNVTKDPDRSSYKKDTEVSLTAVANKG